MLLYAKHLFATRQLPRWLLAMALWGAVALPAQAQNATPTPVAAAVAAGDAASVVMYMAKPAAAQDVQFGDSLIQSVQLEVVDGAEALGAAQQQGVYLSAQSVIILPAPVKEALLQGIPVYFEAQARISRERLWVLSKNVARQQRYWRLSFQPLTRKWRMQMPSESSEAMDGEGAIGLAHTYDELEQALASLQRIVGWHMAPADALKPGVSYTLEFTLALDKSRLPRLVIASDMGRSVWDWRLRWQQEFALPPGNG